MKGIMVSLLIFMTTGIVVGQQNDSSSSFGPTASSRQAFGPDNSNDLLRPLEVAVEADLAEKLREGKILFSGIEARDPETNKELDPSVITGITFFTKGRDPNMMPSLAVKGVPVGNGVIEFALNDQQLRDLGTRQLRYDFNSSERGKYSKVRVVHANSTPRQPARNSGVGSNTGGFAPIVRTPVPDEPNTRQPFGQRTQPFGQRTEQPKQTAFVRPLPLPSPILPGDEDFMGPVAPGPWTNPNQVAQTTPNRGTAPSVTGQFNNNQQFRNGQNLNNGQTNNRRNDGWALPKDNFEKPAQTNFGLAAFQREQEQLRLDRQAQERRELERKQFLAQQAEAARNPNFENWPNLQTKTPMSRIGNQPTFGSGMTYEQQKKQAELEQFESILNNRASGLTRSAALLADEKERAENEKFAQLYRQNQLRTQQPRNTGANLAVPSWNQQQSHAYPTTDQPPVRYATNNNGAGPLGVDYQPSTRDITPRGSGTTPTSIKDYPASIPGPGNSSKTLTKNTESSSRDEKIYGFMLFMLLGSLGLNVYLAFITRGFYVRYNELADELRETFSSTL